MDSVEERLARLEADMARALQLLQAIGTGLEAALRPQAGAGVDVTRGLDRVAYTVTGAERALSGEIKALDARLVALSDEVRELWGNRDRPAPS